MRRSAALDPLHERLLVLRAREGDRAAFDLLVRAYEPRLLYFLRRFAADDHHAADLLQDVWVDAYRKLARLKAPEAFRSWVYRLAHDRAVTSIRRENREAEVLECRASDAEVESVSEFEARERAATVHRALGLLKPEHRAVLTLRFLEDLGLPEMADVLRVPVGTVKSRLYAAKAALRRLLSEECDA